MGSLSIMTAFDAQARSFAPVDRRFRVAIVSSILHPKYGGPAAVIRSQSIAIARYADVDIYGVVGPGEEETVASIFPNVILFPRGFPGRWFRGRGLTRALKRIEKPPDLFHAHMLWDQPVYAAWKASRTLGKPLVVTPHGALSTPSRYSSPHKRLYSRLVVDRMLGDIAFLHVATSAEESACREFGAKCPIRVIPSGLPESEYTRRRSPDAAIVRWPQLRDRRVMLYMGRLWSGKGLDILVDAWAAFVKESPASRDWMLVIAGPDYRGYHRHLSSRIDASGAGSKILLAGHVGGEIKDSLLSSAECFVLPSYGEGFSIALLEAVSARLPVIYTRECNFPELAEAGGGWEISAEKTSLVERLHATTALPHDTLAQIGRKGWSLGMERYNLERNVNELVDLYRVALS
jgi:glycosyltransferase involved in cell wall biosynthesis